MNLIRIPHVTELTSVRSFLGIMDKVRETSLLFTSPTLGMTLLPSETSGIYVLYFYSFIFIF